jgi:lysophospholipase L1-like esterase
MATIDGLSKMTIRDLARLIAGRGTDRSIGLTGSEMRPRRRRSSAMAGALLARSAIAICPLVLADGAVAQSSQCDEIDIAVSTTPVPPQTSGTLHRHAALARQLDPTADLIIIGDSIAQLWGDLPTAFPGQKAINLGIGGDKTQNVLWRLDAMDSAKLHPRRVILILGTNNIMDKPCSVTAGVEAVVDKMSGLWPTAKIDVLEILPRLVPPPLVREAERQEINAKLRVDLASRPQVSTINADRQMSCDNRPDCNAFLPKSLHPSPEGYRILAEAFRRPPQE